jgi:ubiquinone/menaquinone biosynthesis C-methylase UbiE
VELGFQGSLVTSLFAALCQTPDRVGDAIAPLASAIAAAHTNPSLVRLPGSGRRMMPSRENADIAGAYDVWADTYDEDPNRTRELAGEVLRGREVGIAGRKVIEIGCGTGLNTLWLCEHAETVLALDISAGMLRQARAHVQRPNVRFLQHDVRCNWPSADASADAVVGMLVLEHVERLEPVFAQAARVLRPGGELFVCELHPTRQILGRRAEFTNPRTGQREQVAAFLHDVSEYVNGGLRAGFRLLELREWRDTEDGQADPPRLLSMSFDLPTASDARD